MTMHNPPHPGEFIHETYITPFELSIRAVSGRLRVSPSTFSRIIRGESAISPDMACRLSSVLGRTAESWLSMQAKHDLWETKRKVDFSRLESINFDKPTPRHI